MSAPTSLVSYAERNLHPAVAMTEPFRALFAENRQRDRFEPIRRRWHASPYTLVGSGQRTAARNLLNEWLESGSKGFVSILVVLLLAKPH